MKRMLLAGFVLMLAASSTSAAWKKIGRSDGGEVYFLDPASVGKVGELIRVRAKIERPAANSGSQASPSETGGMTALQYVNCRKRTIAVTQVTQYAGDGRTLATGRQAPAAQLHFYAPEPGSFSAVVTELLCTRNPFSEQLRALK